MKILGIIPARYGSSRFPGKPLVDISGKTMIQRVYEAVSRSGIFQKLVVATDDQRIFDHVISFGGNAEMTSPTHENGTERCSEILTHNGYDCDVVVNIQGDEPFLRPEQFSELVQLFQKPEVQIATLFRKMNEDEDATMPGCVKLVTTLDGRVLYFSRSCIPFDRDGRGVGYKKHIGLYAYRSEVLKQLGKLPGTQLERAEQLEQLRWLEHGYAVYAAETKYEGDSVDYPADVERLIRKYLA